MDNLVFYGKLNVKDTYDLKNLKNLMNLTHFQKQLECHQHVLNEILVYYVHNLNAQQIHLALTLSL